MDLNSKHKAFCDDYLITLNATESYMKVYGCSYDTARANGCKLLANANISEYINKRLEEAKTERVANMQDILEFWTDVMNNEYKKLGYNKPLYIKDRQIASESLAKRLELAKDVDKEVKIKIVGAFDE